eukprot:jgi/Chlat1/759/Chrsp104S00025
MPVGPEPLSIRARTKIVATVGPACANRLQELVEAGVDVFRLNTAHGSVEERTTQLAEIRRISKELGRPIGVLCDLSGPKIRLKKLVQDPTECKRDEIYTFMNGTPQKPTELASNYEPLVDEVQVGENIALVDGTVNMEVIEKGDGYVKAKVTGPGPIKSNQGINLPNTTLSVPSLTEKDIMNAEWACKHEVDFISLSFVRTADDIIQLKKFIADRKSQAWVIAKIEMAKAVENLEEIVKATDGIMVARGDLGVEIDIARVPIVQKQLVGLCRRYAVPCIVATQMLDSMTHSRIPTRAEATDVANACLDGTDATMLSGESASGAFPVESVAMMTHIQLLTEPLLKEQDLPPLVLGVGGVSNITAACVHGASKIARQLDAKLIVVATASGHTAILKAKQHDFIPTIVVSKNPGVLRQCNLLWGVVPLEGAPADDPDALQAFIEKWGLEDGCLQKGDSVVMVSGKMGSGIHNAVRVHEVGSD